jgi:hypothetical protein
MNFWFADALDAIEDTPEVEDALKKIEEEIKKMFSSTEEDLWIGVDSSAFRYGCDHPVWDLRRDAELDANPRCECGAQALGFKEAGTSHSSWCPMWRKS